MEKVSYPKGFDGQKFSEKYGLEITDYFIADNFLHYPEGKVGKILSAADLKDCLVDTARLKRVTEREKNAPIKAKAVPLWATWSEEQAAEWFNDRLSDEIIDSFQIPAPIKQFMKDQNTVIKNMGRMIIAQRDHLWPDMPESEG